MGPARLQVITIAGVGLIGGSFALALRRAGFEGRILGVSSPRTLEAAVALGVIDEGVSLEEGAARGDLIYLAQPISIIIEQLPQFARSLKPGALVTDAGSTKQRIVEAASSCLPPLAFLGGHPMAGKESRGVESADPSIFERRTYILTPTEPNQMEQGAARELKTWIERIGARVLILDPATHDAVVALTSHLAQMSSTALALTVEQQLSSPDHLRAAGPGLIDMTRLAMSSFDVWKDIIATNRESISAALDSYITVLQQLRDSLQPPGPESSFHSASLLAKRLRSQV